MCGEAAGIVDRGKVVGRVSEKSRRALCIGVGSFTPAGAANGDEPELTAFEDLDYAASCTRGLEAALRAGGL